MGPPVARLPANSGMAQLAVAGSADPNALLNTLPSTLANGPVMLCRTVIRIRSAMTLSASSAKLSLPVVTN
ncbi:Uncharacterised protein [Bordetella pertussis]|nr:Uncharacterised protein [Bordetella pertussis]